MGNFYELQLVRITSDEAKAKAAWDAVRGVGWIEIMFDALGLIGRVTRIHGDSCDVDTGALGQYHAWTFPCLTPVDWSPSTGEMVRSVVDMDYIKEARGQPVSDAERAFIGPELCVLDTTRKMREGWTIVRIRRGTMCCAWPMSCLIPAGPKEETKERSLDDVLEGLYDARKDGHDASRLLAEYKAMTGKDMPIFMR